MNHMKQSLIRINESQVCCNDIWENAYLSFESPFQEIRKFTRRLERAGARSWPLDSRILEICCGRGNGLIALEKMGFYNLEGVDLSESLLQYYDGLAQCYLADCRHLPFDDGSRDIIIVHGGLHHLKQLPEDVAQCLAEVARVLVKDGLFIAVEPWMTPFLALVDLACRMPFACRLFHELHAIATMNFHERDTYQRWLSKPSLIIDMLSEHFHAEKLSLRFGKILFVGRKASCPISRHSTSDTMAM